MRHVSLMLVVVAGCSTSADPGRPDASAPPEDATVEAGPDGPEPIDAGACVVTESCAPVAEPCDGGFRYGCYGGSCPTGDVGACRVLSYNATTSRYGEACCERQACTREQGPLDLQCLENPDGGAALEPVAAGKGWTCPAGVKPPGTCRAYGLPAPTQGKPGDYCCR